MGASNERGPIAATYDELQSLPLLRHARERLPLPPATSQATLRAVLQAAEVALWNLADLASRAGADLARGAYGQASVTWGWALGFHQVLSALATTWSALGFPVATGPMARVDIADSPALKAFVHTLSRVDLGDLDLTDVIHSFSLDDPRYRLVHLIRLTSHEARQWEAGLSALPAPAGATYDALVSPDLIRAAVFERELSGDNCLLQFRGLHQVNEILVEDANERLDEAVRAVAAGSPDAAAGQLRVVNLLLRVALVALQSMSEHLATSDYHVIRENLGLTSGAHSVAIHHHLFGEIYRDLADAILGRPAGRRWEPVVSAAMELRALIDRWRQLHLHLPRNNLGGGDTSSLIGSANAVAAVEKMRRSARQKEPFRLLAQERGEPPNPATPGSLAGLLDDPASIDSRIVAATGEVTRGRFADVQARTGLFGERPTFRSPPPRDCGGKLRGQVEDTRR